LADTAHPVVSSAAPSTDEGNIKVSDVDSDTPGTVDVAAGLADTAGADKKTRRRSNGKKSAHRQTTAKAVSNEQHADLPDDSVTPTEPDKPGLQTSADAAADETPDSTASAFMQAQLAELNNLLNRLVTANRGEQAAQTVEQHTNGVAVQGLDAIRLARLLKQLRLLLPDSDVSAVAPEDKAAVAARAALTGEAQQLIATLSVTGRGPAALDVLQRYTTNGAKVAELPATMLKTMVAELQIIASA
jgi:hypothetical protein